MATFDGDTAQSMLMGLDEVANTLDTLALPSAGLNKADRREAKDALKEVRETHTQLHRLFDALNLTDTDSNGIGMGEASIKLPKRRRG